MSKTIKQLSVFLENKVGRLGEVTGILAEAEIPIRSIELVEAGDFGILRLIVGETDRAQGLLEERGFSVKLSPVIAVEIAHASGCFHRIVSILAAEGINIQYAYTAHGGPLGIFLIKTDRVEMLRAVEVLEADGVKVLDAL
ncbi:ACT domain-containing protein [Nitratifractor sp.]